VTSQKNSISLKHVTDLAEKLQAMGGSDSDRVKKERIQEAAAEVLFILQKTVHPMAAADQHRLQEILQSHPAGTVACCYVRVERRGEQTEVPLLDLAVTHDHRCAIKPLVAAGAEVNARAYGVIEKVFRRRNAIDLAIEEKKFDIATDLYHLGAQISCLNTGVDAKRWRRNNTQIFEDTLRADHAEFYKVLLCEMDKQVTNVTEEEALNEMDSASILSAGRCFDFLLGRALDKGLLRDSIKAHVTDLLASNVRLLVNDNPDHPFLFPSLMRSASTEHAWEYGYNLLALAVQKVDPPLLNLALRTHEDLTRQLIKNFGDGEIGPVPSALQSIETLPYSAEARQFADTLRRYYDDVSFEWNRVKRQCDLAIATPRAAINEVCAISDEQVRHISQSGHLQDLFSHPVWRQSPEAATHALALIEKLPSYLKEEVAIDTSRIEWAASPPSHVTQGQPQGRAATAAQATERKSS